VTSSAHRGRARRPLAHLSRVFKDHRDEWWESGGFERHQLVNAGGSRWRVIYKIHAIRSSAAHLQRVEFKSSVTVWAQGPRQRRPPRRARDGSDAGARWRQALQRELRRRGYHGKWRAFPATGIFADFWKDLPGAGAVPAEVKRLERLRF
jgi:hypothetical protein